MSEPNPRIQEAGEHMKDAINILVSTHTNDEIRALFNELLDVLGHHEPEAHK